MLILLDGLVRLMFAGLLTAIVWSVWAGGR
jgi:hypothetical protein